MVLPQFLVIAECETILSLFLVRDMVTTALEATNCDSDFASDEEEACSSSGVIRLVVGELSGT